jgi:hypothetical protein
MNRSMIIFATLPLALTFIGCTSDDGPSGTGDDDETGITTMNQGDGDGDTGDGDGDTGDGDGDTGDGDGEGDGDGDMDCGMVSITPEYVPPNVMLVVDASGSMISNDWDHDLDPVTPDETRWMTLHGVVQTIMDQFGPAMNAGIKRFPSESACDPNPCYNATACVVTPNPEVDVGLDNGAAILASIPAADDNGTSVEGGTPSTAGINVAVEHLAAQNPALSRYILFITDGAANCTPGFEFPEVIENYDETLEPTVEAALNDHQITTFVVGIDIINSLLGAGPDGSPEANPYERLNDVALAGGAPKNMGLDPEKFYNSTNQDELLTALSEIIDDITECVIDLSTTDEGVPEPVQIPHVSFEVDGMTVPYIEDLADCETGDGWAWLEYGVVVTFCGSYCDDFKSGGVMFDGTYGCPPPE